MKEIVLQTQGQTVKAAVLEDGNLIEVHEEEGQISHLVGSIYRGRVENVLPGMQAAFVDIGLDRNAFLFVGDAVPHKFSEDEKLPLPPEVKVENVLKPRQEILVQLIKEPVGTKGARVTMNITIPGRYAVLMPKSNYVGVSRKIIDDEQRERLKTLAQKVCPAGKGIIVRTLAADVDAKELEDDLHQLTELWKQIEGKIPKTSVPGLVHQDADLVTRVIRDYVDQNVERLTVNHPDVAVGVRNILKELGHPAANHVDLLYKDEIFPDYGIDNEIRKALRPKVWLKSGGYLVIQQTEALTVIDVNTGKYTGQISLQDTVVHTNHEAAKEIARQLQLRNLGGIIIIDFIDMTSEEDKKHLVEVLEAACARDKIKCHIMGLTQLGLLEMTRKKVGQTLAVRYTKLCPTCEGLGRVR